MRRSKYTIQFHKVFGEITEKSDISKATGIPLRILEEVYDRGMAAWLQSHRPNVGQHQWARARLYSFLMMGKTFQTTDSDLARDALKRQQVKHYFKQIDTLKSSGHI